MMAMKPDSVSGEFPRKLNPVSFEVHLGASAEAQFAVL
jgi:hypothetical protein